MKIVTKLVGLLCIGALATPAFAQKDFPDRGRVTLGAFFIEDIDTELRASTIDPVGIGTTIDFSRNLGLEDDATVGRLGGYYRFTPRHRINWDFYNLDRSGTTTLQIDIEFEDEKFTTGAQVSSFINTTLSVISYTFSFLNNEQVELGIGGGLHILDIEAGIAETAGGTEARADTLAPLPMINWRLRYNISRRWRFLNSLDVFFIDQDDFSGNFVDLTAVVEYQVWKHFGLGFGIDRFGIDLDAEDTDDNERISFDTNSNGLKLYTLFNFISSPNVVAPLYRARGAKKSGSIATTSSPLTVIRTPWKR